jgi:hypothetical protein
MAALASEKGKAQVKISCSRLEDQVVEFEVV